MDKFVARIGRSRVLTINFIAHALIARINIKLLILATRYDYNEISGSRDPMINGIRINSGQRNYRYYANKKKYMLNGFSGSGSFCGLRPTKKKFAYFAVRSWIVMHPLSCCATTICRGNVDPIAHREMKIRRTPTYDESPTHDGIP